MVSLIALSTANPADMLSFKDGQISYSGENVTKLMVGDAGTVPTSFKASEIISITVSEDVVTIISNTKKEYINKSQIKRISNMGNGEFILFM